MRFKTAVAKVELAGGTAVFRAQHLRLDNDEGAETGKRMAGDYVIIHAFHIGDREIVLGGIPGAAPPA